MDERDAAILALRAALGDGHPSLGIRWLAETGSTNADLLAAARAQAEPGPPQLLVADRQTAGRGRRGRHWSSQPGASLTFSLSWPLETVDLAGLSLAVGAAIADAVDPGALRLRLKWPNDLWLVDAAGGHEAGGHEAGGRKVGGILIETAPVGERRIAVIGIGLNVLAQQVEDAASGVGWLGEIDAQATPLSVLCRVVPALLEALPRFEQSGFGAFAGRYASRDLLRGHAVRCSAGAATAPIEGVAVGIGAAGELLVRVDGGGDGGKGGRDAGGGGGDVIEAIVSGEVSVRLAGKGAALPRQAAGSPC